MRHFDRVFRSSGTHSPGNALGSVLMVVALAMVIAFSLAGTSVIHIRTVAHVAASQGASDLAETALASAIQAFGASTDQATAAKWGQAAPYPTFYCYQVTPQSNVTVSKTPPPANPPVYSLSIVTFDPAVAAAHNMQVSINNWGPDPANPPATALKWPSAANGPRFVPPGDILLASKAVVDGVTRQAYALINCPAFPYAIASSGQVNAASGALLVTSATGNVSPSAALAGTQGKGNLASNSTNTAAQGYAVALNNQAVVTGNVLAVGAVNLNGAQVGAAYPGNSPVAMPTISVPTLDPSTHVPPLPTTDLGSGASIPSSNLQGFNKVSNPSTVSGDLNLNSGVLYVDGPLNVTGAIKGTGIVVVNGPVTVGAGSDFTASGNQAAIVAAGNVTLNGAGAGQSFTGLVYSQGNFTANNLTLMGSFVGDSKSPTGTQMALTNVPNVIQNGSVSTFNLTVTNPAPPNYTYGSEMQYVIFGANPGLHVGLNAYTDPNGQTVYAVAGDPSLPPAPLPQFYQTVANYINKVGSVPGWGHPIPTDAATVAANQFTDMSLGGQYPITHFLNYITQPYPPVPNNSGGGGSVSGGGSGNSYNFPFDLNQFISVGDQTRIVYWELD